MSENVDIFVCAPPLHECRDYVTVKQENVAVSEGFVVAINMLYIALHKWKDWMKRECSTISME